MQQEEMQVTLVKLTADPGKVFRRIGEEAPLGRVLWLGKKDNASNFEEVDKPEPELEEELDQEEDA